ncbi:MAG: holo-ACP synthase [Clostridia bacterium]|nr:holo-ACP synthase [Clostridia bacterium]
MVKGIGCDLVAVERFTGKINNEKFLEKVFTAGERQYLVGRTLESAAGIWAGKEAVSKALGCGFLGLSYRDIEILHTKSGQPYVNLTPNLKAKMTKLAAKNIQISITHESNQALAFVIVE